MNAKASMRRFLRAALYACLALAVAFVPGIGNALTGSSLAQIAHAGALPDQPVLVSPSASATGVAIPAALAVTATDPDADNLTVSFYGRPATGGNSQNFTLVAIPDTQYYSAGLNGGTPEIFNSQTQWLVDNQSARNIIFAAHLGDIVENGSNSGPWVPADTAMTILERGTPTDSRDDVPFGLVLGNHDVSGIANFNAHFGVARFSGRPYYGGSYAAGDNSDSYALFTASGMKFIVLLLNCGGSSVSSPVLDWADGLLKSDPARRGIVVCHGLFEQGSTTNFSSIGNAIYDALKDNPNLFLMLAGHVPGEGRRTDPGADGHPIYSLLSDYQMRSNGGDGWLRIMEFQPTNDLIQVRTYRPARTGVVEAWETDASSQFTLSYAMPDSSFQPIGTNAGVSSGSTTTMMWAGLAPGTKYEWYATVSDGTATTTGPTWTFTTGTADQAPVVTLQPQSQTVDQGVTASFTAAADGWPMPTVQWQVSTDQGTTWTDVPGETATTYRVTAMSSNDGWMYRAVFANSAGDATSNAATLTVRAVSAGPAAPSGLKSTLTTTSVALDWTDNPESDLAGYNIYRYSTLEGPYTRINLALVLGSLFNDTTALPGLTYYYRVTAVNAAGQESAQSDSASAQRQIAFRAKSSAASSKATLAVPKPTGLQPGDVMLAAVAIRSTADFPTPAGWKFIRSDVSTSGLRQSIFYRIESAGEAASYSWTFTGAPSSTGVIVAYSRIDTAAAIPEAHGGQANGASGSIGAPAITAGTGSLVVGFFGTASNASISAPGGMLEQVEVAQNGGKAKVALEGSDFIQSSTGSSGTRAAAASTAAANIGQLVSLQALAVAAP